MSYCRLSESSDVYAYKAHDGKKPIWCVQFEEHAPPAHTAITLRGFRAYLDKLKAEGKRIPASALERIDREIAMTRDALEEG